MGSGRVPEAPPPVLGVVCDDGDEEDKDNDEDEDGGDDHLEAPLFAEEEAVERTEERQLWEERRRALGCVIHAVYCSNDQLLLR